MPQRPPVDAKTIARQLGDAGLRTPHADATGAWQPGPKTFQANASAAHVTWSGGLRGEPEGLARVSHALANLGYQPELCTIPDTRRSLVRVTVGPSLVITQWRCPFCVAGLVSVEGRQCLHCHGTGLTGKPLGPAELAPRPPGVMRAACGDCAFRRGSPELENAGAQLPEGEPFYCHQGLPVSAAGSYEPVATFNGLPLGAMVCAGWWAMVTGQPLPAEPFRETTASPSDAQLAKAWRPPAALATLADAGLTDEQLAILRANFTATTTGKQIGLLGLGVGQ